MMRDAKGRFVNGHEKSGGRAPRATEEEYANQFKDIVPLARFAKMVEAQARRAERGDVASFGAICKYLGLDVQKIEQKHEGNLTITLVYERRVQDHTS